MNTGQRGINEPGKNGKIKTLFRTISLRIGKKKKEKKQNENGNLHSKILKVMDRVILWPLILI